MPNGFERESAGVIALGVLLVGVSLTIHAFFMFLILKSQVWLKNRALSNASGVAPTRARGIQARVRLLDAPNPPQNSPAHNVHEKAHGPGQEREYE